MVNVSTLFYVLENLEEKKEEVIDLEEVHDLEEKVLERLFGRIDKTEILFRPSLIKKILQSASID